MHYSKIALAATPLYFTYVAAYGNAVIKNSCGDDVYFWSCGDQPGEMITVPAGTSHSQGYYSKSGGGGPSLKVGVKYSSGPKAGQIPGIWDLPAPNFTQFEYTVGTPGPPSSAVFYDISNINGYPFVSGGVKMTSSDGSVNVACPKGVQYCQAAYNAPHDDHATGSAADHVDLTLELCSDAPGMIVGGTSAGSQGSNGGSSGGSAPEPVAAQPSTQAATTAQPPTNPSHHHVGGVEKLAVAPVEHAAAAITQAPKAPSEEDVVVWHTVVAPPVIVTSYVHQKEKRHDHVHQHVHNKINKKRHGN